MRPAPWLRSSARNATSAYWPVTIRQPQTVSMQQVAVAPDVRQRLLRLRRGRRSAQEEQRDRGQRRHARGDREAPPPARRGARSRAGWRLRSGRRPGCPSAGCRGRCRGGSSGRRAGRGGRRPAWSWLPWRPRARAAARRRGKGATAATSTIPAVASPPTNSVRCSPSRSAAHAGRVRADDPAERERGDDQTREEGREIEILLDVPGQREDALVDQGHAELHPHRETENRPRRAVRLAAQRHRAVATHGESSNAPTFGSVRGRAGPERQSPAGSRIAPAP